MLYLKSDEGVAVTTTSKRLADSVEPFGEEVQIGRVNYIDYKTQSLPWNTVEDVHPSDLVIHKRISFSHEREVRAVTTLAPTVMTPLGVALNSPQPTGVSVPVDLERLITGIYVAPTSPPWFHALVRSVAVKYNLNADVLQSSLAALPFRWAGL